MQNNLLNLLSDSQINMVRNAANHEGVMYIPDCKKRDTVYCARFKSDARVLMHFGLTMPRIGDCIQLTRKGFNFADYTDFTQPTPGGDE